MIARKSSLAGMYQLRKAGDGLASRVLDPLPTWFRMLRVLVRPKLTSRECPPPAIFVGAGNPDNRHTHSHFTARSIPP